MNPQRRGAGPVHSQGPGYLTFTHAPAHTHAHSGLIRGHSHLALMIPGLIHTHISRLCLPKGLTMPLLCATLTTLSTMGNETRGALQPSPFGAKMRTTTSVFNTKYSTIWPSCSHALIRSTKTARQRKGRRGRGVSERRAIKTARSQVLCVVVCEGERVCTRVCVYSLLKEKVLVHQQGPPATRVKALLGCSLGLI